MVSINPIPLKSMQPLPPIPRPQPNNPTGSGLWAMLAIAWCAWLGCLVPPSQAQVSGAMDLWPRNAAVEIGTTRQFGAYVPIAPNTVVWMVNDIVGGNATLGTITTGGLYAAPPVAPENQIVTIKAQSTAFPTSFASTPLAVTRKYPWLWSASPSSLQVGPYEVSFNGANFAPDSKALANGIEIPTTFVSSTRLLASGIATQTGPIQFKVRQPAPGTVTGNVVSVTVSAPTISVAVAPSTASVQLGSSQSFQAIVSGTANPAVSWSVNGTPGGSAATGTISSSGVFTAPTSMPPSSSVVVRASSVANPAVFANATVTLTPAPITPPPTPPSAARLAAGRFLEQSSFGPTPSSLLEVQQIGVTAYLDQQFALPETPIPTPSVNSMGALRQWALHQYTTAPDQLRQRVAYALSQILVTSGNKLVYPNEMLPWLRLLSQHAFGNYRELLRDVTISPAMGKFLDLANSRKPGVAGGANENYPRELLQLFSIGLWLLNPDGSQVLDAAGQPIPAYTQETVSQIALALTGWTYPTAPGATPQNTNWEFFGAPMESRSQNHETSSKSFLGCTLPANQTVEQDLEGVIDCLMQHPNTAPFVVTRLIRSLVMSNPSPDYIERITEVFLDNGAGVRGDLHAVVRALLLDPEARNDAATPHQGRLKEPILQVSGFLRALNGQFSSSQQLTYLFDYMAQSVLAPPSVFSWFSPLYRVPKNTALFGPEFQIYSPTEATLRGNMFYSILQYPGNDVPVDLSPFQPYGNDMPALVEQANQVLLHGRMPPALKQAIITAAAPGYDAKTRIETVLYLTALTGQYAVQH